MLFNKIRTYCFSLIAFTAITVSLPFISYADQPTNAICDGDLLATRKLFVASGTQSISSISTLTFFEGNVENLFNHRGSFVRGQNGEMIQLTNQEIKPEAEIAQIMQMFKKTNADFGILAEVEDQEALRIAAEKYLNNEYIPLLIEGNDPRGIDIGFYIKKDSPFKGELVSNKAEQWKDPVTNRNGPIFARDLPMLLVRDKNSGNGSQPLFIIFGVHAKSKRDRPGDPESMIWKKAEADRIAEVLAKTKKQYPGVPIFMAGDFNIDMQNEDTFASVKKMMTDTFDASQAPVSDRITHTFHPRGGKAEQRQMDAVLVSNEAKGMILSSRVIPYEWNGHILPPAKTFAERSQQPSDHRFIETKVNFQQILATQPK